MPYAILVHLEAACETRAVHIFTCTRVEVMATIIVEGISGIKKHIEDKGRAHRFFFPVHFDGYDD